MASLETPRIPLSWATSMLDVVSSRKDGNSYSGAQWFEFDVCFLLPSWRTISFFIGCSNCQWSTWICWRWTCGNFILHWWVYEIYLNIWIKYIWNLIIKCCVFFRKKLLTKKFYGFKVFSYLRTKKLESSIFIWNQLHNNPCWNYLCSCRNPFKSWRKTCHPWAISKRQPSTAS